jgi:hypothetical protein
MGRKQTADELNAHAKANSYKRGTHREEDSRRDRNILGSEDPRTHAYPGLISPPKQRQHMSPPLSTILPGNYWHLQQPLGLGRKRAGTAMYPLGCTFLAFPYIRILSVILNSTGKS